MQRKVLGVIVSANGFGHLRRQLEIASELLQRNTNLHINLALTESQYRRFFHWIREFGSRVTTFPGLTENSPQWRTTARDFTDKNLSGWLSEFQRNNAFMESDNVLSDNLGEILACRPDAWLSGSFLWSDVLDCYSSENKSCCTFVIRERQLLSRFQPQMLANQFLLTPGVRSYTAAVLIGWIFREPETPKPRNRNNILMVGGGTKSLQDLISQLTLRLRRLGFIVTSDLANDENPFDFSEESWASVGLIVCRPGVGTLTESVKWRIPALMIPEETNSEISHIVKRMSSLNKAAVLPSPLELSDSELRKQIQRAVRTTNPVQFQSGRAGLQQAVEWIERNL
jgi:hypothetical protein